MSRLDESDLEAGYRSFIELFMDATRQRIAYMPLERRRRIHDLGGELLVGAGGA
jgi:hypothetical protein